jgi:predicted TIM-barrel fold metal-dependent hydrolase
MLDDSYHPGSRTTPYLKREPSQIVADGQLFCSAESDEKLVAQTVEQLGENVLLFSTDYPHGGTCWPDGVPLIAERNMSESAKIKMLGANALAFCPRLAAKVPA